MKISKKRAHAVIWAALFTVVGWLTHTVGANAATEETFDTLQIGTTTYRNVTVTTKSTNYVFLVHAGGMMNLKVSELSPELRDKLGIAAPPQPIPQTNNAVVWARTTITKLETPGVKEFREKLAQSLGSDPIGMARSALNDTSPRTVLSLLASLFLCYLLYSYCSQLICQKAGGSPGILVWIPVLQVIPLFRAAGMSGWWFLGLFVPVLQLVPIILWPFKIARARGKSPVTGLFLLLPITNILAFLYLALSDARRSRKDERRMPIMTLETV